MGENLNNIWKKYSNRINPENLDEKKLDTILSKHFKHETKKMRLRSIYDFFLILFIPFFLFYVFAKDASIKIIVIAGSILAIAVVFYLFYQIKYYKLTHSIDLSKNSIKSLYEKISQIQEFVKKYIYFYHLPVYVALIASTGVFFFDKIKDLPAADRLEKIILFIVLAVGAYLWNTFKRRKFIDLTLDAMKSELMTLQEKD